MKQNGGGLALDNNFVFCNLCFFSIPTLARAKQRIAGKAITKWGHSTFHSFNMFQHFFFGCVDSEQSTFWQRTLAEDGLYYFLSHPEVLST